MTCSDHVLGLAPDEPINYGETIVRMLRYRNPDGTVMDLSSATFAVMESVPSIIGTAAILSRKTDADGDYVEFRMERDDALLLKKGRLNKFRLYASFGPLTDDATPLIEILVT